jgi:hypothetical protein|tara:strand:+ start:582 stop:2591 length:2010 start_codon:yes stop_codon:yes gene_type:complete
MLSEALQYHDEGLTVIPVTPGAKHPPLISWKDVQENRPSREQVEQWWKDNPTANIAIVTGKMSNLSVIDFDGREGMESFRDHLQGDLPTTRVHRTPNGSHMLFKYAPALKTTAGILPGVDIRSEGGYIIAPPSIVDGKPYTVLRPRAIQPLLELPRSFNGSKPATSPPPRTPDDSPSWVTDAISNGAGHGQRNEIATRLIGYFHSRGIPKDIITAMMTDFAARCQPPMDLSELRTTIASVTRYRQIAQDIAIEDIPDMSVEGETQLFRWASNGVEVRLDGLYTQKDGLHAQLEINMTTNGKQTHLYGPANWGLMSTTGRGNITRYLKQRIELDWPRIVEDVVRLAHRTYTEQEAVTSLADFEDTPADTWAIYPLALEKQTTVIFGDGGTGKSYLSLACGMSCQTGDSVIPGLFPNVRHNVLYLDWEDEKNTHSGRLQKLAYGLNIVDSVPDIKYLHCYMPLADHLKQIKKAIRQYSIGMVIVDSGAAACGGEPEKPDVALKFFNSLRELRCTVIVICHVTKEDSKGKPFGSAFWHNSPRATFEIVGTEEPTQDEINIGIYHRKANNNQKVQPFALKLRFDAEQATYETAEIGDSDDLIRKLGHRQQLVAVFRREGRAMTVTELHQATSIKYEEGVRKVLNRSKNIFRQVGKDGDRNANTWELNIEEYDA